MILSATVDFAGAYVAKAGFTSPKGAWAVGEEL
jgi:hypothetical protein